MTDFFRFPHTPHLTWLADGKPRDDKVLDATQVDALLSGEVVVEEKLDGANLGFSVDENGVLQAQNRGSYLSRDHAPPQFRALFPWLDARVDALGDALFPDLMLFGEWCWAVHSVRYSALPDWFLAFDVYDRKRQAFWSAQRRDRLVAELGLSTVPTVARGRYDVDALVGLLGRSHHTDGPAEGLYIRRDAGDWLQARAKLVRPSFTQAITEHWSRRGIEKNELVIA